MENELLTKIKEQKMIILNAQEKVLFLENELMGNESSIHTPKGFLAYMEKIVPVIRYLNFTDINAGDMGVKHTSLDYANKGISLSYKGWYINISVYTRTNNFMHIKIHRFKSIAKRRSFYEEMVDPEPLIDINTGDFIAFKDGSYIDHIKKHVFDVMYNFKVEQNRRKAFEEVETKQKNFTPIKF
jgi:hypothetical protein